MNDVTELLGKAAGGDARSLNQLYEHVYAELRAIAARKMASERPGHTLQPTALVNEAYLRLGGAEQFKFQNRAHFFGAAAEAMRRILVENARRKARLKRGGDHERVDLEHLDLAETTPDEKVLLIDEALEQLEKQDPQRARVVVLKFFAGLTNQEVAASLGVTERTVERHWAYARAWLFRAIRQQG